MSIYLHNSITKQKEPLTIPKNKPISWYTCGPTIYDDSHIGHARTFLSFDIIRRVLQHYGHDITFVMNLTDIDDKIINKVNQNLDPSKTYEEQFYSFIKQMEQNLWDDIDSLGIMRPTVVTRVTEYMDKMIEYIQKIIDNGLAYEKNGSVYFDYAAYKERGFDIEPLIKIEQDDFTTCDFTTEKKNKEDFVLWKVAKPGEISFDSPFSKGRCGWHLECSVMASDILGKQFDIHSGGIDLLFPHHQNEIVQANAYNNDPNFKWVNIFLHSGHLTIKGIKMAKSLKNFITIKEFLANVGTSQDLRILFLMHAWDKPLDFCDETIDEAKMVNKRITDFINHARFILKYPKIKNSLSDKDMAFKENLINIRSTIDYNLRDNIDSRSVINNILKLINLTYAYLETDHNQVFIQETLNEIVKILGIFGSIVPKDHDSKNIDSNLEQWIQMIVDLRDDVREIVKTDRKSMEKSTLIKFYNVLDELRDTTFVNHGVQLEDIGTRPTKWFFTK